MRIRKLFNLQGSGSTAPQIAFSPALLTRKPGSLPARLGRQTFYLTPHKPITIGGPNCDIAVLRDGHPFYENLAVTYLGDGKLAMDNRSSSPVLIEKANGARETVKHESNLNPGINFLTVSDKILLADDPASAVNFFALTRAYEIAATEGKIDQTKQAVPNVILEEVKDRLLILMNIQNKVHGSAISGGLLMFASYVLLITACYGLAAICFCSAIPLLFYMSIQIFNLTNEKGNLSRSLFNFFPRGTIRELRKSITFEEYAIIASIIKDDQRLRMISK